MGSGYSSIYSGTGGGSQPLADSYQVVAAMRDVDKQDPDIYDSYGYFKNPTATNIEDAVSDNKVIIDGKVPDGPITYVMDMDGNIIIGKRVNPNDGRKRAPHPTLIGGKDPQVQCAGMITFRKGKILSVDNQSGHYRPNIGSMNKVNDALNKLYDSNPNLFAPGSEWRKRK
ncbi:MAG: hypothetical protein MJ084_02350 [Saccharofermentans sp.]|nr:hypothetical protein [Saccharofermentans sp.]